MGKKLTTIRELIEKDGRWYGGIEPYVFDTGWVARKDWARKFGTNSCCFDGKEDCNSPVLSEKTFRDAWNFFIEGSNTTKKEK